MNKKPKQYSCYQNDNESTAHEEYFVKMSSLHNAFVCTQAGLVINPHLGASPDGFTKCLYSGKECHPNEMNDKHVSFLTKNGLLN